MFDTPFVTYDPFATYNQVDPPQIDYKESNYQLQSLIDNLKNLDFNKRLDVDDLPQIENNHEVKNDEYNIQNNTSDDKDTTQANTETKPNNKKAQLESVLDAQGITGQKKTTLLKIAKIESGYNPKSQAKGSSACGLFGFINSTRKQFSNLSRKDFLNDIDEQVRCASQLYEAQKQFLIRKGFNPSPEAIALRWFSPKWAITYLKNGVDEGKDIFGTTPSKYLKKFREA